MVCSFKSATMKNLDVAHPRDESAIRYQEDGSSPQSIAVHKQVVIGFDGDAKGQVVLRCSLETADSITRGLLMMDESEVIELSAINDALGECANMLAGSLKTKALDPVGKFQLGLPDFSEPKPQGDMEGALVYRVAEGVMSVEVWLS
ncbi:MAG: chemotaxis protein CheX [Planctomycetes bacterium]|nr:chemotaxis protein CheX [Planctomycetota bacterium]